MDVQTARKAVLILLAVCNTWVCAKGYSSDVDALLAVKSVIGGPSKAFVSWDPNTSPCNTTWLGVKCTQNRVTGLILANQTLDGLLSPSIAALTELNTLVLNYNRLGGVVPDVFGNMTNLRFLDLSQNQFAGRLPPSLGDASNLIAMVLSNNNFNQSIPAAFGKLTKLQLLNASSNDLHGSFPAPLVTLPIIQILDFSKNSINGSLPNANVSSSLVLLDVRDNLLSGTIPPAYVSDNLTLRFAGNANLRLPISRAPAPAPAPIPGPPSKSATSPPPDNATSAAPAPQPAAVVIPAATPRTAAATPKPTVTSTPTSNPVVVTPASANQGLTAGSEGRGSDTGVIIGTSVGVAAAAGVIVAALLALLAVRRKRRAGAQSGAYLPTTTKDTWQPFPDARPAMRGYGATRVYPLPMLIRGTHGFAESQQVGTSPGNKVYLATLPDGDPALVKRRDPAIAGFQSKSEFEKEVQELGRLNHRNLVPLAGCCDDDKERILIFAAPATSTLRDHLRAGGVKTLAQPLTWSSRLEIASGIAGAIAYLHSKSSSSSERLYADLASTSVVLDDSLSPRLADFHIEAGGDPDSPLSSSGRSLPRTPPGGSRTGGFEGGESKSVHADVYKFGLILLELLAGRPLFLAGVPVDKRNLVSWVPPLLASRDYAAFLDPHLAGGCTELSLAGLCDLARDCLSDQEVARPGLPEIARRLARCASLQARNDRAESGFRPSPRVGFTREKGWEEEDEYEVRDLPDGIPIGQGLGRAAWDAVGPASGPTSDAGSAR